MTRRAFDPTWQGDRTLRESAILANTDGERHDAAVTVCDREAAGHHDRAGTLDTLQALGLIDYVDRPPFRDPAERRPGAPITPAELYEALRLHDRGLSNNAISAQLGIAESTIRRRIATHRRRAS